MYYKVVSVNKDNQLTSAVARDLVQVTYTPQTWTYPQIGKLFVFWDKDAAMAFSNNKQQVWECEVINPTHDTKKALDFGYVKFNSVRLIEKIISYWNCDYHYDLIFNKLPAFTALVDGVMLTKRIK